MLKKGIKGEKIISRKIDLSFKKMKDYYVAYFFYFWYENSMVSQIYIWIYEWFSTFHKVKNKKNIFNILYQLIDYSMWFIFVFKE